MQVPWEKKKKRGKLKKQYLRKYWWKLSITEERLESSEQSSFWNRAGQIKLYHL